MSELSYAIVADYDGGPYTAELVGPDGINVTECDHRHADFSDAERCARALMEEASDE